MPVNDDLLNAGIRHEVELRRFGAATLRKIVKLLARNGERIEREIRRRNVGDTSFTARRLELLLEAVRAINTAAQRQLADTLRTDARDLAVHEAGFQTDLFKRTIPVQFDYITPSNGQLWAAVNAKPFNGRHLREYFRDLDQATFKRLRDEIRMGYLEGQTTDQIVRRVKDNALLPSKRSAERVVRTALNHTANVAREQVYKGNEDIIKGVQWVSTLDGRTSAVCQARDGKVYKVDSGPRPPAHPNCRSTTVPVTKSWKELGIKLKEAPEGTRASMNGQVPAKLTYNDWLKQQDRKDRGFTNEILGPTKAKLWRKGELNLDRFVDASGREYTIDELRRREPLAFEKADL